MNDEMLSPISRGSDTLNTGIVEVGLEVIARDGEKKRQPSWLPPASDSA